MTIDLATVQAFLVPLLLGAVTTIGIACGAFVVATILGFVIASARYLWPSRVLNGAIQVFVEIYRNVPSLTHLFIIFFGLAYLGIRLESLTAAIIGLGLIGAAVLTEIFRAGFEAVVVTLDTYLLGWRERDLQLAWLPFAHGQGIANYLADPAFRAELEQASERLV